MTDGTVAMLVFFYFAVLYNRGFYFRSNSALHSQTHNQEE